MSRPLLVAAAAALLLSGCAGSETAAAGTAAEGELRVGLLEYEVAVSHRAVTPGPVTLEVTNAGAEGHDLRVEGAAGPAATEVLRPAESAELVVDAPAGSELTLWCTLPGHRAQGMETTIRVEAG